MYAELSSGNVIWEDSGIHNPSVGISRSFGPCSGTVNIIAPLSTVNVTRQIADI